MVKSKNTSFETESTPSPERSEINSVTKRIFISADHGMAIAGLKPHALYMEALRAEERVGF